MVGLVFRKVHHMAIDQPAHYIIDHSAHAHDNERRTVTHHFFPHDAVKLPPDTFNFRGKDHYREQAPAKVTNKIVAKAQFFAVNKAEKTVRILFKVCRQHAKKKYYHDNIYNDPRNTRESITFRPVLLAKARKGQGGEIVHSYYRDHPPYETL